MVVSALGYANIISLMQFVFFKQVVFTTKMMPQLWRCMTGFFITKPKFAIVLDPYFRKMNPVSRRDSRQLLQYTSMAVA